MTRKITLFHIFLLSILFLSYIPILGQKTLNYEHPVKSYSQALELFNKEKYGASLELFDQYIRQNKEVVSEQIIDARYYSLICAMKLFHGDVEHRVYEFLKFHPGNPRINTVKFQMAKYQYDNKKWRKAAEWFEETNRRLLGKEDLAEYNFKIGHAYFLLDKYDTARVFLYEIKDIDSKFTSPAIYYYSHINYEQGNYQTALEGFLRLTDDVTFSPIVPYYIAQIYYQQEKYKEVTDYASGLIDSVAESRKEEMLQIIGNSYFRLEQYEKAIPYLGKYMKDNNQGNRDCKYQLGYSYYMIGGLDEAIGYLEGVANQNDVLGQNALFHLGDAYIKTGQKNKALLAFSAASNLDFDEYIKQEALFNYAVLSYEISFNPFNEAIKAFNRYIELYPYSPKIQEVYNYLVMVYLSTNNYKQALEFLEKIEYKDDDIKKAYQRASFFRGLELFTDLKFDQAIVLFDKSLEFEKYNNMLATRAYFWKAEILYRRRNFKDALVNYNRFMYATSSFKSPEYEKAHYSLAYTYFNEKNYANALLWFNKYLKLEEGKETNDIADSYNRIGDIYFLDADYRRAIESYNKNIERNLFGQDYATFQVGFCYGLLQLHDKKINVMENLMKKYPASSFYDDALYEIGKSYDAIRKPDQAAQYYERVISEFSSSSYSPKSLVKLGLIYYNKDDNNKALHYYKKVVDQYPATDETKNALQGIRNIYVEMGDVDPYYEYIGNLNTPHAKLSVEEKDSISYYAAENIYMSGECEKAKKQFNKYLTSYPSGGFLIHAHFYKADCHFRDKEYEEALKSFNYVISQPSNIFSEQALIGAAWINYSNHKYKEALIQYKQLEQVAEVKSNIRESLLGQLRCHFYMNNFQEAIKNGYKFLEKENRGEEFNREAYYMVATSYNKLGQKGEALEYYKKINHELSTVEGAEAKFRVAEIYFHQEKMEQAEKEIIDFAKKNTSHQYWLAQSFLLLSDILVKKSDNFQAIHTLQSIIDSYENKEDGIIKTAKEKQALIKEEKNPVQGNDMEEILHKDNEFIEKESNLEDINDL
ncbi:MAG: tetratricopeptide repeat protein, partial [bacterium]